MRGHREDMAMISGPFCICSKECGAVHLNMTAWFSGRLTRARTKDHLHGHVTPPAVRTLQHKTGETGPASITSVLD